MKIFIFFGFSSDSILDKVKDTIKYLNSQEKTHKSSISSILSIVNFINFFRTLFGRCGFFCTFANGNELKIKGSKERE